MVYLLIRVPYLFLKPIDHFVNILEFARQLEVSLPLHSKHPASLTLFLFPQLTQLREFPELREVALLFDEQSTLLVTVHVQHLLDALHLLRLASHLPVHLLNLLLFVPALGLLLVDPCPQSLPLLLLGVVQLKVVPQLPGEFVYYFQID